MYRFLTSPDRFAYADDIAWLVVSADIALHMQSMYDTQKNSFQLIVGDDEYEVLEHDEPIRIIERSLFEPDVSYGKAFTLANDGQVRLWSETRRSSVSMTAPPAGMNPGDWMVGCVVEKLFG